MCLSLARATRRQAIDMERSSSQGEVPMRPPVPRLAVMVVIGWSDPSAASPFPWWGVRPRVGIAIRSSSLVEWWRSPLVPRGSGGSPVHEGRLARTGHAEALSWRRCSSSPERSVGDRSPVHGVVLDLTGAPPGADHRSMCAVRSVVRRACRRSWWLMQPPLS